jgi:hypothetical protein
MRLCRWPEEVIDLIKAGRVRSVDLDYDLGESYAGIANPRTGMDVLTFLLDWVAQGNEPPRIRVHTADQKARWRMAELREMIKVRWDAIQNATSAPQAAEPANPEGRGLNASLARFCGDYDEGQ